MSYLTKSKKVELIYHSLHFTLHFISICHKHQNITNEQILLMKMHEDSNKLYPSIVACHQMILDYSIIMYEITHSFEMDIS